MDLKPLLTILGAVALCESSDIGLPGSSPRCQESFECLAFTSCFVGSVPVCRSNQCTCGSVTIERSVEKEPRAMCTSDFQCLIMTCFIGTAKCSGGVCRCSAGKRALVKEPIAMCISSSQCALMECFAGTPRCYYGICQCLAGKREFPQEERALAMCTSDLQCTMTMACFVGSPICRNGGCGCSSLTPIDRRNALEPRAMCKADIECSSRMMCFLGSAMCSGGVCQCPAGKREIQSGP